jgi:hypothetical protein
MSTEKIWAVSMAPNAGQRAVHVSKRLIGTPAWRIHQMKQVPDPNVDPEPYKSVGRPTKEESAIIARLRKENEELLAKLAEQQAKPTEAEPVEVKPDPKSKTKVTA